MRIMTVQSLSDKPVDAKPTQLQRLKAGLRYSVVQSTIKVKNARMKLRASLLYRY